MKTEVSNLRKALHVLLTDQYDSVDLELRDDDETYTEHIVSALIQSNGNRCPFKNYDCIGHCKSNVVGCADGLDADCKREIEDVWKEFIGIDAE